MFYILEVQENNLIFYIIRDFENESEHAVKGWVRIIFGPYETWKEAKDVYYKNRHFNNKFVLKGDIKWLQSLV